MNVEGFQADIRREPETLAALTDAYLAADGPLAALDGALRPPRRVVLTGMGSSRFAALSVARRLRARGLDAHVEYASATVTLPPSPDTLCVAVSASGCSEETVAALGRHAGTSRTVAVTNQPDRALGGVADAVLPLLAGDEAGGIACVSYQCTLAVLLFLGAALVGEAPPAEALRRAVAAGEHLRATAGAWVPRVADELDGQDIDVIGPDDRLAAVEQSALMLREAPRIRAAGCETGDWLHVDVYLSRHPGYRALLLAGSPFDADVMEWARERDSTIVAVGRPVAGSRLDVTYPGADDPLVALLAETTVAELVAAELWQRRGGA